MRFALWILSSDRRDWVVVDTSWALATIRGWATWLSKEGVQVNVTEF